MNPWERKLTLTLAAIAATLALVLSTCDRARAGESFVKAPQSRAPWTIGQCDRLGLGPARAVFNQSIYSHGGWPLWRVVCLYETVR